ncbi:hypothetical protein HI914_02861 [Erysiphe necator]|nr:hypothetical protein HI914_02861 [Erysiphe necator]
MKCSAVALETLWYIIKESYKLIKINIVPKTSYEIFGFSETCVIRTTSYLFGNTRTKSPKRTVS